MLLRFYLLVIKRFQRHIVAALKSQDVANMNPKAVVAGKGT